MGIFAGLAGIGKVADAIDGIRAFFEKMWDKAQRELLKKEVKEETIKDINLKTYEQLDKADAVKSELAGKTPEEIRAIVEASRNTP